MKVSARAKREAQARHLGEAAVISAARAFSPSAMPSAMPVAMAITFFTRRRPRRRPDRWRCRRAGVSPWNLDGALGQRRIVARRHQRGGLAARHLDGEAGAGEHAAAQRRRDVARDLVAEPARASWKPLHSQARRPPAAPMWRSRPFQPGHRRGDHQIRPSRACASAREVAADGERRRQRRIRQIARIAAFALHRGGLRRRAPTAWAGQAGARRQRRAHAPHRVPSGSWVGRPCSVGAGDDAGAVAAGRLGARWASNMAWKFTSASTGGSRRACRRRDDGAQVRVDDARAGDADDLVDLLGSGCCGSRRCRPVWPRPEHTCR